MRAFAFESIILIVKVPVGAVEVGLVILLTVILKV